MLTRRANHTTPFSKFPSYSVDFPYRDTIILSIPKGQIMHIPILAVNTDKEIWGDDAAEFKYVEF